MDTRACASTGLTVERRRGSPGQTSWETCFAQEKDPTNEGLIPDKTEPVGRSLAHSHASGSTCCASVSSSSRPLKASL